MTAQEAQKLLGIRDDQILLLKAALYPTEEALHFWQQWKTYNSLSGEIAEGGPNPLSGGVAEGGGGPFSKIDPDSQRILPLIYRNLEHTSDPLLPALKEVYRHTWMRNQRLLQKAQQVVQACNEAGIPNMLLKGIPMSLHYYKDMGVRPMSDVDLLVPFEYLDRAVEVLKTLGNTPNPTEYKYRHLLHAMHCYDKDGIDVDLHWQAFFFQITGSGNKEFEEDSCVTLTIDGSKTYMLTDALQLFHTIMHGTLEGLPTVRWIPDAIKIYKSMDDKLYKSALDYANVNNVDYAFSLCIGLLKNEFGLEISNVTIPQKALQKSFLQQSLQNPKNLFKRGWRGIIRHIQAYQLFYQRQLSLLPFIIWLAKRSIFRIEECWHQKVPLFNKLN